jgi:hypothetical protein
MRLAVLADVQGNLQALEAVLEYAQKQTVDGIIKRYSWHFRKMSKE